GPILAETWGPQPLRGHVDPAKHPMNITQPTTYSTTGHFDASQRMTANAQLKKGMNSARSTALKPLCLIITSSSQKWLTRTSKYPNAAMSPKLRRDRMPNRRSPTNTMETMIQMATRSVVLRLAETGSGRASARSLSSRREGTIIVRPQPQESVEPAC